MKLKNAELTMKTILLAITLTSIIVGTVVAGVNWYRSSKYVLVKYARLKSRVDKIEITVRAEQASQRVLIEALIKKIMPEEADTIIKQADEMRKALEESFSKRILEDPKK